MKTIVNVFEFQAAIKALGVVAKPNLVDESGKILMKAVDNTLCLSAHNGSVAITKTITADVIAQGEVSILYGKIKSFVMSHKPWDGTSGTKLFDIVSDDKITKIDSNSITENGKKAKGSLKLSNFNPATMPPMPSFNEETFSLKSNILRAATNKVLYAINPTSDALSGPMKGMNVIFDTEYIYFAGTDGKSVSEYQVKNISNVMDSSIILTFDFVMGLKRLLVDDINISFDTKGNKIVAKFDNTLFSGRVIAGETFPDYKPIFDKYVEHINLNKNFLMESLSPIIDMLDPEDNFRLTVEITNNILKLYNDSVCVESDQGIQGGHKFSMDVNGRLLLRTLDAINDDYVLMKFAEGSDILNFDSSTYNDQKALIVAVRKR